MAVRVRFTRIDGYYFRRNRTYGLGVKHVFMLISLEICRQIKWNYCSIGSKFGRLVNDMILKTCVKISSKSDLWLGKNAGLKVK
jgi:hypothetical protein